MVLVRFAVVNVARELFDVAKHVDRAIGTRIFRM